MRLGNDAITKHKNENSAPFIYILRTYLQEIIRARYHKGISGLDRLRINKLPLIHLYLGRCTDFTH